MTGSEWLIGIMAGIGLAAATGFRVFLPMFMLSLAAHLHWLSLNPHLAWLGSKTALVILGVATVAEIMAYLIPWIDHLLDTIAIPLAGLAGTLAVAAVLKDTDPALTWALALIAGGGTATAVQTSTSATRLTSTATTGGLANPLFSSVESFISLILSVLSIVAPLLAILILLLLFWAVYRLFRKKKNRKNT